MSIKKGNLGKGLGKGLGRGLDLLISSEYAQKDSQGQEESPIEQAAQTMVKIRLVEANKSQPRKEFSEESLSELAESIRQFGVLQPILVKKADEHYEIIAGERRWRAAKAAGLKEIPVIIKEYSELEIAQIALIENLQREDLNPIEEAKAYQVLLQTYHLKQEEIAEVVSKGRSVITNSLRLLKLADPVQEWIIQKKLTAGHAKVLLGLEDKKVQTELAEKIIAENLSVRETEKLVKAIQEPKPELPAKQLPDQGLYQTIEDRLKNRVGTMVKIRRKGNHKGRIEIDYYSSEDLERIMEILGVNED